LDWPVDILTSADGCILRDKAGTKVLFRGLRVRMGLHYGKTNPIYDETAKGYDYYGDTVNCASRIESVAFGGQILCSNAFLAQVDAKLMDGLLTTFMGPVSLKGIEHAVPLTEVLDPDVPRSFGGIREAADVTSHGTGNRKRSCVLGPQMQLEETDVDKMGLLEARAEILRLRSIASLIGRENVPEQRNRDGILLGFHQASILEDK